jgi:hypothetical protein
MLTALDRSSGGGLSSNGGGCGFGCDSGGKLLFLQLDAELDCSIVHDVAAPVESLASTIGVVVEDKAPLLRLALVDTFLEACYKTETERTVLAGEESLLAP